MTRLVWYRNDLRILDNPALYYACKNFKGKIIALFISTPVQWKNHNISKKQIIFIYKNLIQLQKSLFSLGINLLFHKSTNFSKMIKWFENFCINKKIKKVFYNKQYELNEIKRDSKIEKILKKKVIFHSFDDSVFYAPKTILNCQGKMYKIFSPFEKKIIQKLYHQKFFLLKAPKKRKNTTDFQKISLNLNFKNKIINKIFPPGEKIALKKLYIFCTKKIKNYKKSKKILFNNQSSLLSPYLNIGIISIRQCFNLLKKENPDLFIHNSEAFLWLKELVWREFYQHLIYCYPFVCKKKSFLKWTEKIKWKKNKKKLNAWKKGMTGYPIIDTAMRKLNSIGWIDNRLRMLSASFLVKDLLIDWRIGEKYFLSHLIDGNFASNNGNWQWVASTGSCKMPYFQIFNPIVKKNFFNIKCIRYWLPELKDVPDKYIQIPHVWAKKNKYILKYPHPIINHIKSCIDTKIAFKNAFCSSSKK